MTKLVTYPPAPGPLEEYALGGASAVANLQLLCGDCNRPKGADL